MEIQLSSGAMGYEPNSSSLAATSTGQCVVCRFPGAELICDWCGCPVHVRCALQSEGFTLCQSDCDQMSMQYGQVQMQQREWLLGRLEQARAQRRQNREFQARRLSAAAGDAVDRTAQVAGAAIGAAVGTAARGVGSLAGGALAGATAAWSAPRRAQGQAPLIPGYGPAGVPGRPIELPQELPNRVVEPDFDSVESQGAGGAEEPRSRADGDALGDQPEPDGREEHDAPDDEGDGAQDDPLIMMGRRVEQLEATLLTFQTVLQGLMEQTDSVMDRLHEVEGKLLPAGPTEQRRPQVPPGVPVVHLGDDGAGGCGGPSAMGGRPLFGQPGTVEPPGLTPMMMMSQMQSPQYDDVRAAWDALKNLTLNKLEYNGRRSRAEQFNTWKDLVALQVQSLGRAGLRVWGEIWTKVDEAYQRTPVHTLYGAVFGEGCERRRGEPSRPRGQAPSSANAGGAGELQAWAADAWNHHVCGDPAGLDGGCRARLDG